MSVYAMLDYHIHVFNQGPGISPERCCRRLYMLFDVYIYIYIYMYMYICIEREREIQIYIYIYISKETGPVVWDFRIGTVMVEMGPA